MGMRTRTLRKLTSYVARYGPEVGPRLYHVLQSQAGHASVGARLRRKIEAIGLRRGRALPLFPDETKPSAVTPSDAPPSPRPGP